MTIDEVLQIDIEEKNILIIGCPASGKTYLANKFNTQNKIIHTDDYMKYGYKESMYKILEHLKETQEKTIVEGIQGYRLLRKGVQLDCYYPDIVIQLVITEQQMMRTYIRERNEKKIKYLKGFNKMHDKIIKDYFLLKNNKPPLWITIKNNHYVHNNFIENFM